MYVLNGGVLSKCVSLAYGGDFLPWSVYLLSSAWQL